MRIRFVFEEFANLFNRLLKRVNVEYAESISEPSATDTNSEQAVCEKEQADDDGNGSEHETFFLGGESLLPASSGQSDEHASSYSSRHCGIGPDFT